MKIYIASSWKNQHAVEMLTEMLRARGHEVVSWIENNYGEGTTDPVHNNQKFDFEEWVNTEKAEQSFQYDTSGAMECDIFVYVGPAGKDAAAECGMAYAKGKYMIGLYAKGEDFGLMRKMFDRWVMNYKDLLGLIDNFVA